MRTERCWCGHRADSHGPRRDGQEHCIACESGTGKNPYFRSEHRYRPIATLKPLPAILFGPLFDHEG